MALGSGNIDFIDLTHKLQKINNDLTYVIEVSGEEKARKSINYLNKNGLVQRKNTI